MKVSDVIIYIMKIMWRDFKKLRLSRFRDKQKKPQKVQILNEVALIEVVRKRVTFQDRKNQNTQKFSSIKIWYQRAFWRYLRIIWAIYNVFIK